MLTILDLAHQCQRARTTTGTRRTREARDRLEAEGQLALDYPEGR